MTPSLDRETCNTLWIGDRLSPLAAACLGSFIELGHPVRIYAYRPLAGVPAGAAVVDAAEIVPQHRMVRHRRSGSVALFSDLFRYELLARGLGLWIDCDVLCVQPLTGNAPYVLGYESETRVGTAILKLPAESPILADLLAIFTETGWTPPWNDWKRNLRDRLRYAIDPGYGPAAMSWGTAGPRALTYFAAKHAIENRLQARDTFYPLPVERASDLLAPGFDPAPYVTPRTRCIHLWSRSIAAFETIPPTGFLAAVLDGTWRQRLPAGVSPGG